MQLNKLIIGVLISAACLTAMAQPAAARAARLQRAAQAQREAMYKLGHRQRPSSGGSPYSPWHEDLEEKLVLLDLEVSLMFYTDREHIDESVAGEATRWVAASQHRSIEDIRANIRRLMAAREQDQSRVQAKPSLASALNTSNSIEAVISALVIAPLGLLIGRASSTAARSAYPPM